MTELFIGLAAVLVIVALAWDSREHHHLWGDDDER